MPESLTRRHFLGRAVAGSAMAGLALRQLPGRAEETPASRLRVGVMGLSRGSSLATSFAREPGVEVKYLCDTDASRTASVAQMFETKLGMTPKTITDFRRILDDPEIDVLVCSAPNHWHAPATILACSAGKHVYVEKPCCHNPREGEMMVEAARKHQCAVQMGTQRRSGPGTREAMRRLHEGVIGRVYLSRSWYNNARGSIGRGKPAPVPAQLDYELWQGPAPRRPTSTIGSLTIGTGSGTGATANSGTTVCTRWTSAGGVSRPTIPPG